jgi:hypothetical protein
LKDFCWKFLARITFPIKKDFNEEKFKDNLETIIKDNGYIILKRW